MAFDGITIACLAAELKDSLLGGRIHKIAQPETDELILTCRGNQGVKKLLISASASLPYLYFTEQNKPNPLSAPAFCMLLRKHIGSARITGITQPGLERVLFIDLEHLNEMGDLCQKRLIIEIMGKHSNIIFCDQDGKILDEFRARGPARPGRFHPQDPGQAGSPGTLGKRSPHTGLHPSHGDRQSPLWHLHRHQPHHGQ